MNTNITICLDGGHGSNTKGKRSPDGRLLEYAWAREMVGMIAPRLKSLGFPVEIVTPEETDISISERVRRVNAICNKKGAKNVLLVSVHNNAAGNAGAWTSARGFSVFVSKNASSNSKKCAGFFTDEAVKRNLMGNRAVPSCKYWTWSWTSADIGILKNSKCPAVLTENLFQDNRDDVEYLLSAAGKEELADLHVQAIINYVNSL